MDVGPILLAFLVVGALAVAAIVGLLYAGFARGRARWVPVPFILVLVTAIQSIDGDVRFAAAFAVPISVAAIVFTRPAAGSAYAAGERIGMARAWGIFALVGGALFAALVVDGMSSPAHLYPKSSFELEFEASETVAVRTITISGEDLPAGTEIQRLRVSAGTFVGLQRDSGDDLRCGLCDAHYLATFVRADPGEPVNMTVGLEVNIAVPHRYANEVRTGDIMFDVETRESAYREISIAASETIPLGADRPFDIVRVSTRIPSSAMVSTGLQEWPGLWVVKDQISYPGTDIPTARAFRNTFGSLDNCEAGVDCSYDDDALIRLPDGIASIEAELDIAGAIYYFEDADPGGDAAVDVQISRPVSWYVETISGELSSESATSYGVRQTVELAGLLPGESPVIVGVHSYERAGGSTAEWITKGTCGPDRCWIDIFVETFGAPATPVRWTASIHVGFFESDASVVDVVFDDIVVTEYQDDI